MAIQIEWGQLTQVLGVIAFLATAWLIFRKRVVRLWQPEYIINRLEYHKEGGLLATLISQNRGSGQKFVSHISLTAIVRGIGQDWKKTWRATFIPEESSDATFVLSEGVSTHEIRLRLYGTTESKSKFFCPSITLFNHDETESRNRYLMLGWDTEVEFLLKGSEGEIKLRGKTLSIPVAIEHPSLRRRLARAFF